MGCRDSKADSLEQIALAAVAAPFAGFGAAEVLAMDVLFILGVGLFCAWMAVTSFVLLDSYKRQTHSRHSVELHEGDGPSLNGD